MPDTMIERVAAIVAEASGRSWLSLGEESRGWFIKEARRILTAMREPTEAMTSASAEVSGYNGYYGEEPDNRQAAKEAWQVMIDAALAEED
jgi:hypothetical protein